MCCDEVTPTRAGDAAPNEVPHRTARRFRLRPSIEAIKGRQRVWGGEALLSRPLLCPQCNRQSSVAETKDTHYDLFNVPLRATCTRLGRLRISAVRATARTSLTVVHVSE